VVRGIILALSIAFTASIALSLITSIWPSYAPLLFTFLMFMPLVGAIIACKAEGDSLLKYGLSELSLRDVKRSFPVKTLVLIAKVYGSSFTKKQYTLIAVVYVYILSAINFLLYFIVYGSPPSVKEAIMALTRGLVPEELVPVVVASIAIGVFINALIILLPALGEEACWRGYLLDKFEEKLGFTAAAILVGVVWGLWHSPLILIVGYEYGVKYPNPKALLGVLVFTVFCVILGYFFAWLRRKSGTATVPALAHATYNGGASLLMVTYWSRDMFYTGVVGVPAIVSLIIFLFLLQLARVVYRGLRESS